jgi:hypothetical protein
MYYHQEDGFALLAAEQDQLNQFKEQFLQRIQKTSFATPIPSSSNLRTSASVDSHISTENWVPTFRPVPTPTLAPSTRPTASAVTVSGVVRKHYADKDRNPKKRWNSKGSKTTPLNDKDKRKRKKKNRARKYSRNEILDLDAEWGYNGELPWIEVLPTKKIPLKKDRRVAFHNLTLLSMKRSPGPRSTVSGRSRDLLLAEERLRNHIFHRNISLADGSVPLDETIEQVYKSCNGPVHLGMATVKDDLYWQLIENFFYTAVRFEYSECAMIICISDDKCVQQCADAYFPCYNYRYHAEYDGDPLPLQPGEEWSPPEEDDHEKQLSIQRAEKKKMRVKIPTMEQIAQVKLLLVPKALNRGVSVFLLDLDVGFLHDPVHLVRPFIETPIVDIMVQEDMIFIMNRSRAGWRSWFTEPLPNIGLFLARGNARTQLVFDIAWDKYRGMDDDYEKQQPGRDQNHVLDAMRITRGTAAMKYAYYDNNTASLLDKLVLKHGNVMELGGELLAKFLAEKGTIAMHATCYEKSTKVHGLRAAAAFWNPRHYDPLVKTITKVLLYQSEQQILEEVRSLIYLAISTGRKVIIPNIIGDPHPPPSRTYPDMNRIALVNEQYRLWPGFRVVFLKRTHGRNDLDIDILEPGFYWRIQRDYDEPDPITPLFFHPGKHNLLDIKDMLLEDPYRSATRIVLAADHSQGPKHSNGGKAISEKVQNYRLHMSNLLSKWANDSIGIYPQPYAATAQQYRLLPEVKPARHNGAERDKRIVNDIMMGMRLCRNVFHPPAGNRTCFQVCD